MDYTEAIEAAFRDGTLGRFEGQYEPCPTTGCWLWTGTLQSKGYGLLSTTRRAGPLLAHRIAWLLLRGPIPPGGQVLHSCDVPCCVNPGHLFIGSASDNTADMVRKGRGNFWGWNGGRTG